MPSRKVLTCIFLTVVFGFLIWNNLHKPRVMIIHSYSPDFPWSRDINVGLKRILDGKPYLIREHYLDTKRNPDKDYMERAGMAARHEIEKWRPNVIIPIDDNAQDMIGTHYINVPGISVVFTGVNAEGSTYKYDKADNVTGVLERVPFKAVHEAFMLINPKGRFYHICDSSNTSKYIHDELEQFTWDPLELVETKLCDTFDDWKKNVTEANEKADFLLITHYHTIKRNDIVMSPKEVLNWTSENTKIPMVGCWDFFVEDGGMLSVSVSPYEQGEEAAKMAVEIIEKSKKPTDIKWYRNVQFTISMRGSQLNKFPEVVVPRIFEAFARGVNHYFD